MSALSEVTKTDTKLRETTIAGGAAPTAAADAMNLLRRYHLGEPTAAQQTLPVTDGLLPALLNPYRDVAKIRYEYPLYLSPPTSADGGPLAMPVHRFLHETVEAFAAGPDAARILHDNLPWIERFVRERVAPSERPMPAAALLVQAAEALQEHLHLADGSRALLAADLEKLTSSVPAQGQFLGYGPYVALQLLVHVIHHRVHRLHEAFGQEVREGIRGLKTLLGIERGKAAVANEPDTVSGTVGSAARYFDASALSGVLEQRRRGSVPMSVERRQRICEALKVLEDYHEDPVLVRLVGPVEDSWCADPTLVEIVGSSEPCAKAIEIYDEEAKRFAQVFAATRVARLETEASYDPAVHDSWFANFDWQAFSNEEVRMITTVVALESAERIAGDGLRACSRLLVSGKPVQVVVWSNAFDNPGAGTDRFQSFRFELAYFGIGHRQVYVAQASAARHADLLCGFSAALDSTRAGLHLIDRGLADDGPRAALDPWIVASAAVESRAHPFIQLNPAAGDNAAERVNITGNPQPERDWTMNTFTPPRAQAGDTVMGLAFTFADYALLIPQLRDYFRVVPQDLEAEDLLGVPAYLDLPADQADRAVPFVWAIDGAGVMHRLVVARSLMLAARDRQNYWRTLQELGGIRNRYVELAVAKARAEAAAAAATEREQLVAAHQEELERVRSETAGQVMGQLVDALLETDFSNFGIARPLAPIPASTPAADAETLLAAEPPSAATTPAAGAEDDAVSFDEPWVESILCTTCDDCMSVNKLVFAYNENKQAVIANARAGTYAQLVEAAELCPARCIHPGKPLNPAEPGLDDLIKRAEPYN